MRIAALIWQLAVVLFLGSAIVPAVFAQADVDPPVLTSFDFSPKNVDVTNGSADITCDWSVQDPLSGVASKWCIFHSPTGSRQETCFGSLTSGDVHNGTYSCGITIPQYSAEGTWQATVLVDDAVGNTSTYRPDDLAGLGFPTDLEVTSDEDTDPPVLTSFDFSPKNVDVTNGSADITCDWSVQDPLSGVASKWCIFHSPTGSRQETCFGSLTSGDVHNGTYSCGITIPQYSAEGTWQATVLVDDAVGNTSTYRPDDLAGLGFPTDLEVTSDEDTDPPVLTSFDFSPKNVDVTNGSADITCDWSVQDPLSGVASKWCIFHSPTGSRQETCFGSLTSGDVHNGTYSCGITIPQYSAEGTWQATVLVDDAVGNTSTYRPDDLAGLGFPTDLEVGFVAGSPIAAISTPRNGKRVRGNSLTIKARLAQGSPDDVSPTLGVRFDFRALPSGIFAAIPARNANHPNPDSAYPYFTHWDVSGVANGDYELRAVAHDLVDDIPDPAPETITVTIDHVGVVDVDENFTAASVQESRAAMDNGAESQVGSGDWTDASTAAELVVPSGALTFATDTAILNFPDPAGEEPLLDPSEQGIGAFVAVALESGQTDFEGGMTSDLVVSYSDADQDGYVDGIGIPENELELRYYDAGADAYVPMPGWTVMTEHNQIHSGTTFTGKFGIVPEPSTGMLLSAGACLLAAMSRRRYRA